MLKIFISSTAADLLEYREKVIETIQSLDDHKPVAMEFLGARPKDPVEVSLEKVKVCDALVVLVAHRYGWVPQKGDHELADGRKSITRLEVEVALDASIPVFAFLVDPDFGWTQRREGDGVETATDESDVLSIFRAVKALREFKNFLESEAKLTRATFTTAENLARKVVVALATWRKPNCVVMPGLALPVSTSTPAVSQRSPKRPSAGLGRLFCRSKLLRPEALRVDPSNPDHLIGRRVEVDKLAELCRDHPLVFVVGESGSGKSALIQSGLVPLLFGAGGLLPIYVSAWGADWVAGPRVALAREISATLHRVGHLASDERVEPEEMFQRLGRIPSLEGRPTPLLLLDQFDDYVALHGARMIDTGRGAILRADQLAERNLFWAGIRDLLLGQQIHVLVVTRSDSTIELDAVRFVEPVIFPIARPPHSIVGELLGRLTADTDPVIADPCCGWTTLCQVIEKDLQDSEDDSVLPIRIRTVLQGLADLPRLTVRAYRRADGADGLEVRHVERSVVTAARLLGVDRRDVLYDLVSLITKDVGSEERRSAGSSRILRRSAVMRRASRRPGSIWRTVASCAPWRTRRPARGISFSITITS